MGRRGDNTSREEAVKTFLKLFSQVYDGIYFGDNDVILGQRKSHLSKQMSSSLHSVTKEVKEGRGVLSLFILIQMYIKFIRYADTVFSSLSALLYTIVYLSFNKFY